MGSNRYRSYCNGCPSTTKRSVFVGVGGVYKSLGSKNLYRTVNCSAERKGTRAFEKRTDFAQWREREPSRRPAASPHVESALGQRKPAALIVRVLSDE
ncbi:hypothetical protein NDU88_004300 [Pleurodeles waltl]|uniref:Uncharacterized protein n=1 Tax=Pleurodeles waltl TaxID=8319 RepID=A0AAV7RL56_PLEWA|nr:hypothetical protein NDU88_004300 [Pleurodeles waltl]